MTLLNLIIGLVLLGGAIYLVQLAPIDGTVKQIIKVILIIVLIVWLLRGLFGVGLLNQPIGF